MSEGASPTITLPEQAEEAFRQRDADTSPEVPEHLSRALAADADVYAEEVVFLQQDADVHAAAEAAPGDAAGWRRMKRPTAGRRQPVKLIITFVLLS